MKDFFKIMNKPVDGKTKFKFVMRYINGEPALKLGRELHSHGSNPAQQIYFWRQLYLKAGISALKPKSHDQKIKHKRKRPIDWSKFTREELIQFIKIYDKFINKNKVNKRRDKFQVVKNYRGVLSIKKLWFGAGFKSFLILLMTQKSTKQSIQCYLISTTQVAILRTTPFLVFAGCMSIYSGIFKTHLNSKTVHRYMRHLGLKARIRTKKRTRTTKTTKRGGENLIKQQFVAKHPHQKLFTDASYIRINNK